MQPEGSLRWLGRLVVPGVVDGEHSFQLEPTATDTQRGFDQLGAHLQQRCSAGSASTTR